MSETFQQSEESRGLPDPAEFNAECLDFNEQVLYVNDFVTNQALQKDANKAHEPVLHVLVLDVFTGRDAVRDVEVDKFRRQVDRSREPVYDLH